MFVQIPIYYNYVCALFFPPHSIIFHIWIIYVCPTVRRRLIGPGQLQVRSADGWALEPFLWLGSDHGQLCNGEQTLCIYHILFKMCLNEVIDIQYLKNVYFTTSSPATSRALLICFSDKVLSATKLTTLKYYQSRPKSTPKYWHTCAKYCAEMHRPRTAKKCTNPQAHTGLVLRIGAGSKLVASNRADSSFCRVLT